MTRPAPRPRTPCRWTEDEDGNWDTECGHRFSFTIGGPIWNGQRFCGYCGRPVREVRPRRKAKR